LHRTPVVFLTALVTKAEARSGLEIQGTSILAKPISIQSSSQALNDIACARSVLTVTVYLLAVAL